MMRTSVFSRVAIAFAGLFGALGTAGAALAAHGGGDRQMLTIAAAIAFVHAPALLALGLVGPGRLRARALPGSAWIVGVLLFSGDLGSRAFLDGRLFVNAAPTGGSILIVGWASLVVLAFLPTRDSAVRHGRDEPMRERDEKGRGRR